MLRWVALKRRIDNSDSGGNAMLGRVSPNPQQPGSSTTITPGPGLGPGGFGSSSGGQTVVIGEAPATILSWTPSLITITVPAQGTYPCVLPVVVTTAGGTVAAGLDLMTVYPLITGLSRTTSQPGASLTITGANFGPGTGTITIDGHGATVTSWGASSVTVTVPAALAYPVFGAVVLTTAPGNVAVGPDYTITVPNPVITHAQQPLGTNVVTAAAGSTLEIIGTHFGASQGTGTLKIHGHAAVVSLWSDTRVTVTVPTESSYPDVSGIILTTGGALVSNTLAFTTTAPIPPPVITSLSELHGHPGDSLVLTGTDFGASQGAGGVTLHGAIATVTAWADLSVTVTVPTPGSYPDTGNVVLTTGGAQTSNAISFLTLAPYALKASGFLASSSEFLWSADNPFLNLSGGSFTIACWIQCPDLTTNGIAIGKRGPSTPTAAYRLNTNSDSAGAISWWTWTAGGFHLAPDLLLPSINTWHLWIGYVDTAGSFGHSLDNGAALTAAMPAGGVNSTLTTDFFLGGQGQLHTAPLGNYYNGMLDSVGIWNRLLSGAETAALYNGAVGLAYQDLAYANSGSLLSGLNAWWDLDETAGTPRVDASGNGNTLSLSGITPTQVTGIR